MDDRPTIRFRVDDTNEAHTRLSVFIGRTPGTRAHCGQLTVRTDELVELLPDPATADILGRLGAPDLLDLRGPITPDTRNAASALRDAYLALHTQEDDDA